MATFAQRQHQPHQQASASLARSNMAALGSQRGTHHPTRSILQSPRPTGVPAAQQSTQTHGEEMRPGPVSLSAAAGPQFDFTRMPLTAPPIQCKLAVSAPGDRFEREADTVADTVMRILDPAPFGAAIHSAIEPAAGAGPAAIQRACARCEEEQKKSAPHQRTAAIHPVAQQGVEEGEEEYPPVTQAVIMRAAASATPPANDASAPAIGDRLNARQTRGEPLPAAARQRMEKAFGHDFSRVRIHRDAEAGAISRQLSAQAFTHGRHIYFGNGMYDPAGSSGRRLLAHELTHVVQQGQASRQSQSAAARPATGVSNAPTALQRSTSPLIQRTATWTARPVHEVNNLASAILNGTAVGVTWPMLNGSTFWSRAAARGLLARPTISVSAAPGGGFDASVATVPTNTGSFDETVLAPGPWNTAVPKATVGGRFAALAQCTGADMTTFRARGMPDDAAMFAANRRHEDRHARDHQNAFISNVLVWDIRLTVARVVRSTFHGATAADAEAALHAAMGGTPDQIADAFMDGCALGVTDYHGTAAGGPVSADNPAANANCTTSSVESTNPS